MKTLTQIFRTPILALIFFSAGLSLYAQQEGMRGVGRVNAPAEVAAGRNLLFVIGVNDYADWMVLDNAVHDAEAIEEVLSELYGFTPVLPALLNTDATRSNILAHLDMLRLELEPDDNLIFFFAGHGCTRTDSVGQKVHQRGYLVPVDGAPLSEGRWSTYISVEEIVNEIALLPARHITLVLDACHSGIALGNDATSFRGNEEGPPLSLVSKTSRRVITSARADQLASDRGGNNQNSLFTGVLADGLRFGQADLDNDGMISTSEIGLFMQREVRKQSDDMQTPDFGAFALDERGEMVLMVEANSPVTLRNNAQAQLRNGKVVDFLRTFEKLRQVDSTSLESLYLASLYHVFTGNVDKAVEALERRANRELEELPDNVLRVLVLTRQQGVEGLKRWRPFLRQTVSSGFEVLDIQLMAGREWVEPDSIFRQGATFNLSADSNFSFQISNTSDRPLFIYGIMMDLIGRIRSFRLWEDFDLLWGGGLQPGQTARTSNFSPVEVGGMSILRLVIAEERLDDFVLTPDISATNWVAEPSGRYRLQNLFLVFK